MAAETKIVADMLTTMDPNKQAAVDATVTPAERRGSVVPEAAGGETVTGRSIPTEDQMNTLRKVSGKIPWICYAFCIVEFSERASYYGVAGVFSNFIQYPLPEGGNGAGAPPRGTQETAGALGMGVQAASALYLLFVFLAYVFPILGGYVADTKLGRYKTIVIGVLICGVAHIIMVIAAIPSILQAGHAIAPFIISMLMLAFGAGMFKCNIAPTILDQYTEQEPYLETLNTGETVIVDPETTMQRILLIFYGLINIGAFFSVATTYSEKYVGYWLAFLIPGILYMMMPGILAVLYKRTIKVPPNGTVLTHVFQIIGMALKRGGLKGMGRNGFWHAAKPSVLAEQGITTYRNKPITWTDGLVDDVARTFAACEIFLFFPIYNLNDGGIGSIATSQAAAMTTNGAPNDLISNLNPLAIIIAIPIINYGIYPFLRKHRIRFGRIRRLCFGFFIAAVSAAIGAIIQWRVYETSPCGYHASSDCTIGTGVSPLNVWIQTPMWVLGALSEIFCNVTAYELAYARAPKSMKGLVMALFLFTTALSSALGEALSPVLNDPYLIWPWVGTSIAGFLLTILCYWKYRSLDEDEFMRTSTLAADSTDDVVQGRSASVVSAGKKSVPEKSEAKDFGEEPATTTTAAPATTAEVSTVEKTEAEKEAEAQKV